MEVQILLTAPKGVFMAKKLIKIDPYERVKRLSYIFSFFVRLAASFLLIFNRVKVVKQNTIPKPPYIVISTHHSLLDIAAAIKATKPHHPYWIASIDEFYSKNFVFRKFGVIPKRKYSSDPRSAKIYMDILKDRKKILIFYPEATFTYVGHEERHDDGIGQLAKVCDVPIVFINCHGHYLWLPQWGDRKPRRVSHMVTEVKQLVTLKQVREWSSEDIDAFIRDAFKYDEEEYQLKNNIKIKYKNRAFGLHRVLYKCPHCGKEFKMSSKKAYLTCDNCGVSYYLEENGTLSCVNAEAKFNKISDWYYWEKEETRKEVESGTFFFKDEVKAMILSGVGIGFLPMRGRYYMVCNTEGITVTGGTDFNFYRPAIQSWGLQIDYNYKHTGAYIGLTDNVDTYFFYPKTNPFILTKLRFAVEFCYDIKKKQLRNNVEIS